MLQRLRSWAASLKRDVLALWFAYRDPRTPMPAKIVAMLIVAYALSPIDLIPDFIPILGYLDELILLPAAIYLTIKLVPAPVLAQAREQAATWIAQRKAGPRSHLGTALIVAVWLALFWALWSWLAPRAW